MRNSTFFVNVHQIFLLRRKKRFGFCHECCDTVAQGVMLLPILRLEENTVTFEAVHPFMAVCAFCLPYMLFHALDQTTSGSAAWCRASKSASGATLRPKLVWDFSLLVNIIFVTVNAKLIIFML